MWILILMMSYLLAQKSSALDLIDIPSPDEHLTTTNEDPVIVRRQMSSPEYPPTKSTATIRQTRHWIFRQSDINASPPSDEEKDSNIKKKISTLVQQTIHDTERKIKSIQHLKDKNREQAPYRIGFILSMVKKARDVLNELFNVAVKHREQWKALEQLKIFELIVHTNVDTTNLVRQLVEIHIQYLNSTNNILRTDKKRVVLL